jgi:hypothetical protein
MLRDDHSSGPRITAGLKRPTRRLCRAEPARVSRKPEGGREIPPYLVLLRVGFALPGALLPRRCALTAPFHPYQGLAARAVCFLWHLPSNRLEPAVPDVIRHTALRSSDFPPVSRRATVRSGCQQIDYSADDVSNRCTRGVRAPRKTLRLFQRLRPQPVLALAETHKPAAPLRSAAESTRSYRRHRHDRQHAKIPLDQSPRQP